MKNALLLTSFLFTAVLANAQTPQLTWAKSLGGTLSDFASSLKVDASGNVYTTGQFGGTVDYNPGAGTYNLTSTGGQDIYISKLDASGNFVWAKSFGSITNDVGKSIVVDIAGNVYTTGIFQGTVDFDPGAGISNLTSVGDGDIFILKLDVSGNFVWAKSMGGKLGDVSNSIALDASGNIYTSGQFRGTVDFDPGAGIFNIDSIGSYDIFISKLNASGNFVWAKSIGGISGSIINAMTSDATGNVYIAGYFFETHDFDPGAGTFNLTSAGGVDIFISKINASGDFVWAKGMGGTTGDQAISIIADATGNVYTTGSFQGTADFDPGAGTFNLTSADSKVDIFISKLDASGNFVWAKSMGGLSYDIGQSIAVDASGNVYTTGPYGGTVDFDPGAGIFNLTPLSSGTVSDFFISKLDASGNFVWATSIGGTLSDKANSIFVDGSGNVYATGYYNGIVDFDPGAGTLNLTSAGSSDMFVLKMNQKTGGISENANINDIAIYPNPNNGAFNVLIPNAVNNATIVIYNCIGTLVYKLESTSELNTIDLNKEANGLYLIKVISNNTLIASQKIMKH